MSATSKFQFQTLQILRDECLGTGSYGKVCKAMLDQLPCSAKLLHPVLFQFNDPHSQVIIQRFEKECEFLSEIRHPNVVQYLGVARDPESGLLVLLMELLDESLTQFLQQSNEPLPYHLEVNLCYDISLALAYLHLNRIIHRDLSSNNVLLIAGNRAKVADFGMSKLSELHHHTTPSTPCPGTAVYMPPEALLTPAVYSEKLDIFSTGVIAVQIMTRNFPDPGQATIVHEDRHYPTGTIIVPIPEVERRKKHIDLIDVTHPLLAVAMDCLRDHNVERPSAPQLCDRLAALREAPKFIESKQQKQHEIETLRQRMEYARVRLEEKDKQLGQRDRELEQKTQNLEQKMQELQVKDQENLELQDELCEKKRVIEQLQSCMRGVYTYKVSGPGLQWATANTATHLSVEVMDADGKPIHSDHLVTAELKSKCGAKASEVKVVQKTLYKVSYTSQLRGCYTLHVSVNRTEIQGSPFNVVVYPDPTQLCQPLRVIEGVENPWGVAFNSCGEMYVTEWSAHQVSVFDNSGKKAIGSHGYGPGQLVFPTGIAIDRSDNIFVTSDHKLQKFKRNGEFVKSVGGGSKGNKPGEFNGPRGVKVHHDRVYVCDCNNHRIQVFDFELKCITSFGKKGSGPGQFNEPWDLTFDRQRNAYVSELYNSRVQVLDPNGCYIREFDREEARQPRGIETVGDLIYLTDSSSKKCLVYHTSGKLMSSFGSIESPRGVCVDVNGFIYVCSFEGAGKVIVF